MKSDKLLREAYVQRFAYEFNEYLGIYDLGDITERLVRLREGTEIYQRTGASFYEFQYFQKKRYRCYCLVTFVVYSVYFLCAALVTVCGAPLVFAVLLLISGFVAVRMFSGKNIMTNVMHSSRLMEGQPGFENAKLLGELDASDANQVCALWIKIGWKSSISTVASASTVSASHPDLADCHFKDKLEVIAAKTNIFNAMPMIKVINFFSIICCKACAPDIPQISEEEFIWFLESAFLGKKCTRKILLRNRRVMITHQIFHQFYILSCNQLYAQKASNFDGYIRLLTEHFEGFDFDKVRNNFRTNDNKQLDNIREKYKSELQSIQPIQTIRNDQYETLT